MFEGVSRVLGVVYEDSRAYTWPKGGSWALTSLVLGAHTIV